MSELRGDCISRAVAIDAINHVVIKFPGLLRDRQKKTVIETMKLTKNTIENALIKLPSVEPEKCSHEDIAKAFQMGTAFGFGKKYDEMDKVIEEVKKASTPKPETRWIPISKRLPEDGTWNIFTDGNTMSIERYKADAMDHFYPEGRWFSLDKVIAWMPLPEPYRAESEDKE